jgi:hypothetical protein
MPTCCARPPTASLVTDSHRLGWIITFIVALAIAATLTLDHYRWGTRAPARAATVEATITTDVDSTTAADVVEVTTIPTIIVPAETSPPTTDNGVNLLGGDSPEDKRMPNVVCMNLQDAQNEIQDHGVFFSKSVDASGDGRRQLIDSNWIVVAQTPAVGEKIGEGDAVLSVVKKDEPNDCP